MIVDYAKSRDVNVNNCYIIIYRGCDTIIGCKIMVLDDYVEVALRRETCVQKMGEARGVE